MVADHPRRFGAFAILPLPDVGAAIRETEYALDVLKLEGVCLLTHVDGRHLGQPEEDELYAELDRRKRGGVRSSAAQSSPEHAGL